MTVPAPVPIVPAPKYIKIPTITPIVAVETIPFPGYDGTYIGSNELIKETDGKSVLSPFNGAEGFLYRMHQTVVNDMKKDNPTPEEEKKQGKREKYEDMFQDYKKEHPKTELAKNPISFLGGKKKLKRKTKKSKKRSRRSKKNKK